jgi:lipopolysaccharide biosynthesis glycosyltransferase
MTDGLAETVERPQPSRVVVACAADGHYALPLAVMLSSAGFHAGPGTSVEAYVLDDGLGGEDRAKVAASLPEQVRLHWRRPPSGLPGVPVWGRMSGTTYHKLTLAEWLPAELDRVLWLDCDLLVLADLSRLWRIPQKGCVTLAAQDLRVPLVSARFGVAAWRELGLPAGAKYFNAGVMVIDLARWREREVGRRSLEYVRAHADRIYFWDQEALNAVLAGAWSELEPHWNWHPALDHLPGRRADARAREPAAPRIVHFSGNLKPWEFAGRGPHWKLYERYVDRTEWAGRRPPRRWRDAVLSWYESSRLRRLLYPAEQWGNMVVRALTRTYRQGKRGSRS